MKNDNRRNPFGNVILLSIVSFLNDLSSEMIMPILPMFLKSLGATSLIVGLTGGLQESISSILKVLCGYWSDKSGKRKIFIYFGYGVSVVFKLLLGLSRTWHAALAFASAERVGKGLRTAARDAIIAESMTTSRGKGFGIHRGLDTAGAILGSSASFVLLWFAGLEIRTIIIVAGVVGLFALIPIRFVKEPPVEKHNAGLKISLAMLPRPLKLFILVGGIFALGNFSYMFFVMNAQQLFTGKSSLAAPVLLYILYNIFYSVLAVPFGSISDRIGRPPVIIFGFALFAVVSFGFAFSNSLWLFIILFALYGVVFAAVDGTQRAFVSDLAAANLKATALGTFHTVTGLAALPASLIAGFLWQRISPAATFTFGGTMALVAVVVFLIFQKNFTAVKTRPETFDEK